MPHKNAQTTNTDLDPQRATVGGAPNEETRLTTPTTMADEDGDSGTLVCWKICSVYVVMTSTALICWMNSIIIVRVNPSLGPRFSNRSFFSPVNCFDSTTADCKHRMFWSQIQELTIKKCLLIKCQD